MDSCVCVSPARRRRYLRSSPKVVNLSRISVGIDAPMFPAESRLAAPDLLTDRPYFHRWRILGKKCRVYPGLCRYVHFRCGVRCVPRELHRQKVLGLRNATAHPPGVCRLEVDQRLCETHLGRSQMNMKTKFILGGACVASVIAGLAVATPTIGAWYNVILSTGTVNRDVSAHAHVALPGTEEGFSAALETEGAANFIVQEVKFSPGGTTGWHTH